MDESEDVKQLREELLHLTPKSRSLLALLVKLEEGDNVVEALVAKVKVEIGVDGVREATNEDGPGTSAPASPFIGIRAGSGRYFFVTKSAGLITTSDYDAVTNAYRLDRQRLPFDSEIHTRWIVREALRFIDDDAVVNFMIGKASSPKTSSQLYQAMQNRYGTKYRPAKYEAMGCLMLCDDSFMEDAQGFCLQVENEVRAKLKGHPKFDKYLSKASSGSMVKGDTSGHNFCVYIAFKFLGAAARF